MIEEGMEESLLEVRRESWPVRDRKTRGGKESVHWRLEV